MKCRRIESKCECKECINMKDFYCTHFKSNNMCDKCDYKGEVTYCPNKQMKQ